MIIFKAKEDRAELSFNPMEGGGMKQEAYGPKLWFTSKGGGGEKSRPRRRGGDTIYISRISSINHILPLCF